MGREPASNALVLQIRVEPFGENLIFAGVADETRIELDGFSAQRREVFDKNIGQPASSYK